MVSFMNIEYNIGLSTLPCRTPQDVLNLLDILLFILIAKDVFV